METEKHGHHHLFHGEKKLEKTPEQQLKHHKNMQRLAKVGTVTAGAYALHEKHKTKKDPENAHSHRIKEEIAATVAVGGVVLVMHEHHEKKAAKKKIKEGKKKGNGL
ncbi:abscisic stress-ripening protein 1-like isoform X2 [Nymphaea colorata]|nr:abscisic stress-ripening protein 1-like isoform X2 [Nymphaea colorata]